MFQKFLFPRSAGKIKYKYLFTLALLAIIIAGLFLAGWASAEQQFAQKTFQEKLKFYLQQAKQEITSLLKKPLNRLNSWSEKKLSDLKGNFYRELEEMKISLLNLLKWGWKEGVKSRL